MLRRQNVWLVTTCNADHLTDDSGDHTHPSYGPQSTKGVCRNTPNHTAISNLR